MKVYIKASKKSNLGLLESFAGKDQWVLVTLHNLYTDKVVRKGLIKIDRIKGRHIFFYEIPLAFNYNLNYDSALDYIVAENTNIDNVLKHKNTWVKDCVHVVEPVESYTTAEIREAIEKANAAEDTESGGYDN